MSTEIMITLEDEEIDTLTCMVTGLGKEFISLIAKMDKEVLLENGLKQMVKRAKQAEEQKK